MFLAGGSAAVAGNGHGHGHGDHDHGPTIVRVAAVQMPLVIYSPATNLQRALGHLETAAANGAKLVVFSECMLTGYKYNDPEDAMPWAEEVPAGSLTQAMAAAAQRLGVYVVSGIIEREGNHVYDAAILVGPEGYIGKYRKATMGFMSESLIFTRDIDFGWPVFNTAIGRIAIGICYDGSMPESTRVPALRGVDISAYPYSGAGVLINQYALSRSEENNSYTILSNRNGIDERGGTSEGRSGIYAPGWKTLAQASTDQEEIIYADLDLSALDRSWWHTRRPELYGLTAQPLPRALMALETNPESHVFGNSEVAWVRIVTASVAPGTPVEVTVLQNGVFPMFTVNSVTTDNCLTIQVPMPATLPVGAYKIRVVINGEAGLTDQADYTVKAFNYPHNRGFSPNSTGASTRSNLVVGYDQDIMPATNVPVTLVGGGQTFALKGSINQPPGVPPGRKDNLLTIPYPTLKNLTVYTATVPANVVRNAAGVGNDALTWSFTTTRVPLMVNIALAQTDPAKGDTAANLQDMLAQLDAAKAKGAKLVVFPELAVSGTGFRSKGEALPFAEEVPGPSVYAMTARAQELGLYAAFGLLERAPRDHGHGTNLYSTSVLVGPEGYIGKYRKAHLGPYDRSFLKQGDIAFPAFDTVSIGRVGMLLGEDVWHPEAARAMLVQNATIVAIGGNATNPIFQELALTRGGENKFYVAVANRVGQEGSRTFNGMSQIAATSRFVFFGPAPANSKALINGSVNIDTVMLKLALPGVSKANQKNSAISYTLDRRPELYQSLTWRNGHHEGGHDDDDHDHGHGHD
jgi:predicted amidohydrolase